MTKKQRLKMRWHTDVMDVWEVPFTHTNTHTGNSQQKKKKKQTNNPGCLFGFCVCARLSTKAKPKKERNEEKKERKERKKRLFVGSIARTRNFAGNIHEMPSGRSVCGKRKLTCTDNWPLCQQKKNQSKYKRQGATNTTKPKQKKKKGKLCRSLNSHGIQYFVLYPTTQIGLGSECVSCVSVCVSVCLCVHATPPPLFPCPSHPHPAFVP